jgi:hypothetical protein
VLIWLGEEKEGEEIGTLFDLLTKVEGEVKILRDLIEI